MVIAAEIHFLIPVGGTPGDRRGLSRLAMVEERSPLGNGGAGGADPDPLRNRPTYQPAHFGRVYAAYGGWFVVLSILWGWGVDHIPPDRYDLIGGAVCLMGIAVIMYWPR